MGNAVTKNDRETAKAAKGGLQELTLGESGKLSSGGNI